MNLYTSLDRKRIIQAERMEVESKLRTLKAHKTAARRSYRTRRLPEPQFQQHLNLLNEQIGVVARQLVDITDETYVETIYKCLDKTDLPDVVYCVVRKMLEKYGLETISERKNDCAVKRKIRQYYDIYEPVAFRAYSEGKDPETGEENPNHPLRSVGVWCPVMQDFQASDLRNRPLRTLSHIIPSRLGNQNVATILGYDPDETPLDSIHNLLYLHNNIEKALDRGHLTFIPVSDRITHPMNYRLLVTNPAILSDIVSHRTTFADLNGQQLKFRNKNRPAKRIIYLHNVIVYMRAKLLKWEGFESLQSALFGAPAYATPDALLRAQILRFLAAEEACNLPKEIMARTFERSPFGTCEPSDAYLERRARNMLATISEIDPPIMAQGIPHLSDSEISSEDGIYSDDGDLD